MSVDLLRQQPRWKEALVSLREIMTSLVQQVLLSQAYMYEPLLLLIGYGYGEFLQENSNKINSNRTPLLATYFFVVYYLFS